MDYYETITEIDHIGKAIFGLLSNEELCNVRLVCKTWKDFVGNAKFWKCRILKKFQKNYSDIGGFHLRLFGFPILHQSYIGLGKTEHMSVTILKLPDRTKS